MNDQKCAKKEQTQKSSCKKSFTFGYVQSPKKVFVHGLVNFVPAIAYLFCLALPAAFSQPHTKTFFGLPVQFYLDTMRKRNLANVRRLGAPSVRERETFGK